MPKAHQQKVVHAEQGLRGAHGHLRTPNQQSMLAFVDNARAQSRLSPADSVDDLERAAESGIPVGSSGQRAVGVRDGVTKDLGMLMNG